MGHEVQTFFDPPTGSWSYLVVDAGSRQAVIIDPVLDFDAAAARTGRSGADRLLQAVREHNLDVAWILETHAHADHLTAAAYLKEQLGAPLAVGAGICKVQQTFARIFNLGDGFPTDGSQFDRLLQDGDSLPLGELTIRVLATPGHTSDSLSYLIGDAVFVGDTLFMPDVGSARCDFPGGDAATLYHSVQRLYALGDATRMFVCHDYPPAPRPPRCETTVAAQRAGNVHLRDGVGLDAFVALRTARDATLGMPRLILPSIQVNIRAGQLPPPQDNGVSYLKLPLDVL
ncbi:MBL fold metallo-hydrolase [Immundisolibacter sp.]|uniref:MBL fold metallo-hydrolase n=1 Tax=Immundisolibacter sp. TaxID=1934948 RepID=UPI0019CB64BE|nr:MBL fold metallo-hydrolase [Immundisolibacter sp.]MBC7161270.1 MBL fold metallo-hydrolase [Immundisolibacter sp.]MEA3218929.1 putative metallo-hydrolase [Immundisolibacter sp.]